MSICICRYLNSKFFYSTLLYFILFYSTLLNSILFYSILFYSIPFYSIPSYPILFYSILSFYILFYSILFYSILAQQTTQLFENNGSLQCSGSRFKPMPFEMFSDIHSNLLPISCLSCGIIKNDFIYWSPYLNHFH